MRKNYIWFKAKGEKHGLYFDKALSLQAMVENNIRLAGEYRITHQDEDQLLLAVAIIGKRLNDEMLEVMKTHRQLRDRGIPYE